MPLDFQVVDVKFLKGQEQRSSPKLVMPGSWQKLINFSLSETNQPQRRDGAIVINSSAVGNGLAAHNDELLTVSGAAVSTVDPAGFVKQANGELPFVDVAKSEVDFTNGSHDSLDVAYGDGYACYVWREYSSALVVTGIKCAVIELSSGAKLVNSATLSAIATDTSPRVVFFGGAFYIFYASAASGIYGHIIETNNPAVVGVQTLLAASADTSAKNIDACAFPDGICVSVVYMVAAPSAISVRGLAVTRTGAVPSLSLPVADLITAVEVTEASIWAITCQAFDVGQNSVGVFLVHTAGGLVGSGLVGLVFDTTYAVTTAATQIDATTPPVAAPTHVTATPVNGNMQVFFDQQSSFGTVNIRPLQSMVVTKTLFVFTAAGLIMRSACYDTNAARARGPQGPFIAGKAFTVGIRTFLPVCMLEDYFEAVTALGTTLNTQCSFWLLDTTGASLNASALSPVVAGALYRSLGLIDPTLAGAAPTVQTPCSVSGPTNTGGYLIALQERGDLQLVRGVNLTPVGVSSVTLTPRTTTGAVSGQLSETTYIAGGLLGTYDSKQAVSAGFPNFPEGIRPTRVALGGALTIGVHYVCAVYEWTDGTGNRWQSAPSIPVPVTITVGTDHIDVLVPTTQLAQSAGYDATISTLEVVCYMTAAAGLTFYRTANTNYLPLQNNRAVSVVTFNIGAVAMTDDVLTGNELLYTQPLVGGSTLPTIQPGPVSAFAAGESRLVYLKADQPFRYGISQKVLPNTGLQFNEALGGELPAESGGGVAVAFLDEKIILFGKRRIYVVYGNPPDSAGNNNGLSAPQDIQCDVGCSDVRSVLSEVPGGIIFKSEQGWHMLKRDLSVEYIGSGVSDYDSYAVRSAVLMEDRKEARFSLASGVTLVFSTLVNEWSVFIYGNTSVDDSNGYQLADAIWWPATRRYTWISTSVGLNNDVPHAFDDTIGANAAVKFFTIARTGFLKLGALEGFQRVRWLYFTGSCPTADLATLNSTIAMTVYFNDAYDNPSLPYTVSFLTATLKAFAVVTGQSVDFRHKIQLQKSKSIAFQFAEQTNAPIAPETQSSALQGLQAMALEVGLKKGVRRMPFPNTV